MLGSINPEQITALAEQFGVAVDTLKKKLNAHNETIAVWWDKVLGSIILTDTGEYLANEDLQDFNQRKTLFPGKDNFVVLPRNGVRINAILDDQGNFSHYQREFLETAFNRPCYLIRHTQGTEVTPSHLFNDVKQQQVIHTLEVLFVNWEIDLNTSNDFVQFPEIIPNVFFRLVTPTTTTYTEGKEFWTRAVFQSINDTYSNSGRALDQYVHKGTPGECFPVYKVITQGNKKVLKLATERLFTMPVNNVQLEIFGAGILNSIAVYGRPTSQYGKCTPTEDLAPTTILFAEKFLPPQVSTLTKKALPTSTFYFFRKGHTDVRFYFSSYNQKLTSFYDEQTRPNTQGFMVIEPPTKNMSAIMAMRKSVKAVDNAGNVVPNPGGDTGVTGEAWNKYYQGNEQDQYPAQDVLTNQGTLPPWTIRTKIWDDHDIPLTFDGETQERLWTIPYPFLDATLSGTSYDGGRYSYLTLPSTMKTHDIFNLNALLYFDTWKLPVDFTTVTAVSNDVLKLIGGILNVIGVGGIPTSFQFAKTWTPQKTFMGFVPSVLAEWSMCYINNPGNRTLLPFGMFRNDTPDTATPLVAPHCENTTIRFALTDQMEDKNTHEVFNTLDLGQDPAKFPDKKTWKYNPNKHVATIRSAQTTGFYIDAVVIKAISKADFRLSFYNNHTPLWQGRYQTESKWDGNDRSWATVIQFSPWGSNLANKHEYPYPKPWNAPIPPDYDYDWQQRTDVWWQRYEWISHFHKQALLVRMDNASGNEEWTNDPLKDLTTWTPLGSRQTTAKDPFKLGGMNYDYSQNLIVRPDSEPVYLWVPYFTSYSFDYLFECRRQSDLGQWQDVSQWTYNPTPQRFQEFKVSWNAPRRTINQKITKDGLPQYTITETIPVQVSYRFQTATFRVEWADNYNFVITFKIIWDKDTPNKAIFTFEYIFMDLRWESSIEPLDRYPSDYFREIPWNADLATRINTPSFWADWLPNIGIENWNFTKGL